MSDEGARGGGARTTRSSSLTWGRSGDFFVAC